MINNPLAKRMARIGALVISVGRPFTRRTCSFQTGFFLGMLGAHRPAKPGATCRVKVGRLSEVIWSTLEPPCVGENDSMIIKHHQHDLVNQPLHAYMISTMNKLGLLTP